MLAIVVLPSLMAGAQPRPEPLHVLPTESRWSVALSAPPSGPPVIAGGVVAAPLQSGLVVAHALADGAEAWRIERAPEQPLATDGTRVLIAAGEALYAIDAVSGAVAWTAPVGTVTAPILAQQGWVIAAAGGKLTALRADNGAVVWTREVGPGRVSPSVEGNRLYVPLADGRVLALELKTGATLWQRTLAGEPTEILALPDRLYLGSSDKYFYVLDADDGKVEWRFAVRAPLRGRPVLAGDHVIVAADNNELRAFHHGRGDLRWRQGLRFRPTAGPVLVGTAVLVPGTTAELGAYATADRRDAGTITFPATLAVPFAVGELRGQPVIAALTGTLTEQWSLVLLETPLPRPTAPIQPDFTDPGWRTGFDSIIVG